MVGEYSCNAKKNYHQLFEHQRFIWCQINKNAYLVLLITVLFPWFWVTSTLPCYIGAFESQTIANTSTQSTANTNDDHKWDQLKCNTEINEKFMKNAPKKSINVCILSRFWWNQIKILDLSANDLKCIVTRTWVSEHRFSAQLTNNVWVI